MNQLIGGIFNLYSESKLKLEINLVGMLGGRFRVDLLIEADEFNRMLRSDLKSLIVTINSWVNYFSSFFEFFDEL